MLHMDLAPPPCSRTRHHHLKIATTHLQEKSATLSGRLHMIPTRVGVDYPIITPAVSLAPHHHLHRHQMEKNPMTAMQSKEMFVEDLLFKDDN